MRHLLPLALLAALTPLAQAQPNPTPAPIDIRVATFNIEDLRTHELLEPYSPRVRRAAEVIQRLRPTAILINEITYDQPGDPAFAGEPAGQNAARLAKLLATQLHPAVPPLQMTPFAAPSNTGVASGLDLDNSGDTITIIPPQPQPNPDGSPVAQTAAGRAYGGDAYGFGTFPGQYAMALLVDSRVNILEDRIRTFRLFPWRAMPGALIPTHPTNPTPEPSESTDPSDPTPDPAPEPEPWYSEEAWQAFRLSSKSHWDIPIRLPNGATLHLLASHPTPPAFDGPEQRNKKRNHDEIRFWADYIDNASYIIDDNTRQGGLRTGAHFVILGDLNADPDEGSALNNPIQNLLLRSRHINAAVTPTAALEVPGLDPDDTALFGIRADYALPSNTMTVLGSGIWRYPVANADFPSDHFPVWLDLRVPAPNRSTNPTNPR
jgi:hypothetical protein